MKQITILLSLTIAIFLYSCNDNSKKEKAKNSWKEKTYSNVSGAQPVQSGSTQSGAVKILSDKNFDKVIAEGVTLIDFWATWCKPCLMQAPIVEQVASELIDEVAVYKMDVDKNPFVPQRFNIQNIPTIMVFKDGKMVEKFVGLQNKATLVNALKKHRENS